MNFALSLLQRFVENPWVNIVVGLILLGSGLSEAWDTLWEDLRTGNIGAHHGAIVYGLFHALKYLPDVFEGSEYLQRRVD